MITRVDERSPETSMTESVMGPCADGGVDGASAMTEATRTTSAAVKTTRLMGSSGMKSRQGELADEGLHHAPPPTGGRRAPPPSLAAGVGGGPAPPPLPPPPPGLSP